MLTALPSSLAPPARTPGGLVRLLGVLRSLDYAFTAVTPDTHALVNARPDNAEARSLQDVLGWNRPFRPDILTPGVFDALVSAGACEPLGQGPLWRATLRVSSARGQLFLHSSFPTLEADAVFFGPDSYRFATAVLDCAEPASRVVDVGCGSGVAGILLAKSGRIRDELVLADVNERALAAARVNAEAAGVRATVATSDVLRGVHGEVDLILANPPYMNDAAGRAYRHGGGHYGEALGARIAVEALQRLGTQARGGTLLLYTGAPVRRGEDLFLSSIRSQLEALATSYAYREIDPDVFPSELSQPAYRDIERIAAVFLQARV